jgi:anti-sigma-K factor RskA
MIDELKEEQASIYALGLMEPQEALAFEEELRRNAELRKFVDDLLQSSAAMVHAVPARSAPSHLKEKILNEIRSGKAPGKGKESDRVIPFLRPIVWLPWAMAAGFMVMCGWLYSDRIKLKNQISQVQQDKDVCEMQVALLDPMGEKMRGVATVVWDSSTQTGVINGQNMPQPAANQDYQLWVLDDRYPEPVDAGVFSVDENGKTSSMFKPKQKVSATDKFAVTIEKKGGAPQHEGPIVYMSGNKSK